MPVQPIDEVGTWPAEGIRTSISIVNWDTTTSWDVVEWWGRNSKIAGDKPWKVFTIPEAKPGVRLPSGDIIPSSNAVVRSMRYNFIGTWPYWFDPGVALKIVSNNDSSKGFMVKTMNRTSGYKKLHLSDSLRNGSLEDYYKDSDLWAPVMSFTTTMDDKKVSVFSEPRGGYEYHVEVNIGY